MSARTKGAAGAALLLAVLVVVGGVVVVRAGVVDRVLDSCTDESRASAAVVADALRRDLPGRTEPVEVDGYCWNEPWPRIGTATSADRDAIIDALVEPWECRVQQGSSPPSWDCADVDGVEATLDVYTDGLVSANAR